MAILERIKGIIPSLKKKVTRAHIKRRWEYIVIHHSATKDTKTGAARDAIRWYHIHKNGWNDIGYHFVIEYNMDELPILQTGRDLNTTGAHTIVPDITDTRYYNRKGIGICVVGDYDRGRVPLDKLEFTASLASQLQYIFNIPNENVIGHGEVLEISNSKRKSSCPGTRFDMEELRGFL